MADETPPPQIPAPEVTAPTASAVLPATSPLPPAWRGALVAVGSPIAALVVFFAVAIGIMIALRFTGHDASKLAELFSEHAMLMVLVLYAMWAGCAAFGIALFYRVPRAALGVRSPRTLGWVLGTPFVTVPLFFLAVALADGTQRILQQVSPYWAEQALKLAEAASPPVPDAVWSYQGIVFIVALAVSAPIVEEFIFRGLVFEMLRRRGFWLAALGSSVLFSAFHVNPLAFFSIFVLAMVMAWQRERSGSLLPSMLLHALYNGSWVVAAFLGKGG